MKAMNIFFCYARKDELLRQGLETQLKILKRQGLIEMWHDRNITAGMEWEREIALRMNNAQIILLLVSPDFMDSEYCYSREMKQAMGKHKRGEARVIPIILRPVLWQKAPFGKLQALPTDGKPVTDTTYWKDQDTAFLNVADGIRKAVEYLDKHPLIKPATPSKVNSKNASITKARVTPEMIRSGLHIPYKKDLHGVDLHDADLHEVDLANANLMEASLHGANLRRSNLRETDLYRANLYRSYLDGADLSGADLSGADLSGADLYGANLVGANLTGAKLIRANLAGANLANVDLIGADFTGADLSGADLTHAIMWSTLFAQVDISQVKGLETVHHQGPSTIGLDTLYRSRGDVPVIFLRGAGFPDTMIEYIYSLVRQPIEYYTCFIRYASQDQDFAQRLYTDLQGKGVRCWLASEAEDRRFGRSIDESIRVYDKLILVLSEHFAKDRWGGSQWGASEARQALAKEEKENRVVLFPILLDNTVEASNLDWITHIRSSRHISDFTEWKNHDSYQEALSRLIHGLKAKPKNL